MKRLYFLIMLATVLLGLSGCAALQGQDLGDDTTSDEGISALVNNRLNDDTMTGRATLSATVANGLATLYGTVPDEATRRRAILILEGTPGIDEVLDRTRRQ